MENLLAQPLLIVLLLIGVVLVLFGIATELLRGSKFFTHHASLFTLSGIWPAGVGTVLTVLALLLTAGWHQTAYYPSTADLQSSLTLANSCSSEFTLRTMFWVSLLVPFVLAYIVYAWRKIDSRKLTQDDIVNDESY